MNISQLNISQLMPEIIILALAIVVLCADMLLKTESKRRLWDIAFFGLLIALVLTARPFMGSWIAVDAFQGQAVSDGLTVFIRLIIISTLFITFIFSIDWLNDKPGKIGIFIFLTLISSLGALVLSSAGDLLIMLIGLEILSVPMYILAGFHREAIEGREAAFKYFILGSFASAFYALGMMLIFMATSSTNLAQIRLLGTGFANPSIPLKIGLALIIATFAFKGGLMPFYAWLPDVYRGSPDYVVGFMAAVAKTSVFASLIRIGTAFAPSAGPSLIAILAILFLFTVILGNLMALWQDDVKRMLAYSSITHTGYLLLGLMTFNQLGLGSIIFYLLIYSFAAVGSFIIMGIVFRLRGNYLLSSLDGLSEQSPICALAMTVFMIALSGIPPLAGFFGKLFLFNGAVDRGLWRYVVIASIASLIGVYYYFRVIVNMYMKPLPLGITVLRYQSLGFYTKTALLLSVALLIILGIIPGRFYDAACLFLKTLFV